MLDLVALLVGDATFDGIAYDVANQNPNAGILQSFVDLPHVDCHFPVIRFIAVGVD